MKTARFLTVVSLFLVVVPAPGHAESADQFRSLSPDAMTKELERCKGLNEKAGSDERCQSVYAENRRRFFTSHDDYHPLPVEMFPSASKEPWSMSPKAALGQPGKMR